MPPDPPPPASVSAGGAATDCPVGAVPCSTPGERGQASVEFVVLLPAVVVVLAAALQALLAGQAAWEARVAARAAARANAFGHDAVAAARGHLRADLERGLLVKAGAEGDVRVSVRIPSILPSVSMGRVSATSHFRPQA